MPPWSVLTHVAHFEIACLNPLLPIAVRGCPMRRYRRRQTIGLALPSESQARRPAQRGQYIGTIAGYGGAGTRQVAVAERSGFRRRQVVSNDDQRVCDSDPERFARVRQPPQQCPFVGCFPQGGAHRDHRQWLRILVAPSRSDARYRIGGANQRAGSSPRPSPSANCA